MAAGRSQRIAALAPILLLSAGNNADEPRLSVTVEGLRSNKGLLRGCLTRNPAFFPNCDKDPHSMKVSIAAGPGAQLHFAGMASGDYALSVLHDENANAKLDTMLGIPKEGVGFSENPKLRFSAPKFEAARFTMKKSDISKTVRIKYFL